MPQNHSIGSVSLQVRASRQADGFALQQDVSRWFLEEFLPVLDEVLSELAPEGELIRLDQLDVHALTLPPGRWRQELTAALAAALREKLERLIRFPAASELGAVKRVPLAQGHFEAWLWFLEHGRLPVQYANIPEEERLQAVLESVAAQTGALNRLIGVLRQSPGALQRLALQHQPAFLTQLASAITGRAMNTLAEQPALLYNFLNATPLREWMQAELPQKAGKSPGSIPVRQLETRFWQHVFEALSSEAQSFDVRIFTENFFETQVTELLQIPFQTAWQHATRPTEPDDLAKKDHPKQSLPAKTHFETWLWFLQNGQLPANPAAGAQVERLAGVLDAVAREPVAARQLSRLLLHHPKALQRLVLEHEIAFLLQLAEALTGKNLGALSGMPVPLYKAITGKALQELVQIALPRTEIFNAIVIPETSLGIWYWQELLVAAASELQKFDDHTFLSGFFKQAFALIYKIPYSEFVGHAVHAAAASEKQRLAVLRKLDQLQRNFKRTKVLQTFSQQELEPLREQLLSEPSQTDTAAGAAPSLAEPAAPPTSSPGEAVKLPAVHLTAWTWFLQYGYFPPGYIAGDMPETKRLSAVLEALSSQPSALKSLRRLLLRHPLALQRLVLQHRAGFLTDLAHLFAGTPLLYSQDQAGILYDYLASSPVQDLVGQTLPHRERFVADPLAARQMEVWFWQELLPALAGNAKKFDYQNFIRDFFYWAFQRVFKMSFSEWAQRAIRLTSTAGKKRSAVQRLLPAVVQQLTGNEVLRLYLLPEWEPVLQQISAPPTQKIIVPTEQQPESQTGASAPESGAPPPTETQKTRGKQVRPEAPPVKPDSPVTDDPRQETPATEAPNVQYLQNVGLVLLHPFLVPLFEATGIVQENEYVDAEARTRAVQLLHYLATGSTDAPEYALGMPKFLCGMPHDMPADRQSLLGEQDLEEGESMLQAVIRHWGALGQVSNNSLREGFLQREGKLSRRDAEWLLQVESKTIDLLIGRLPWGLGIVKLPWMPELLHVEWY